MPIILDQSPAQIRGSDQVCRGLSSERIELSSSVRLIAGHSRGVQCYVQLNATAAASCEAVSNAMQDRAAKELTRSQIHCCVTGMCDPHLGLKAPQRT
jgi:hypothetical protein